jgi:hypothetical protein
MIHAKFTGSLAENLRWMLNQHKLTPGKFLVPYASNREKFRGMGISPVMYSTNLRAYQIFFMYDFFLQHYVSLQDVIDLDKRGCDVYITGIPVKNLPKYFLDYTIQNYPETMI